jgi:hypothetical protein
MLPSTPITVMPVVEARRLDFHCHRGRNDQPTTALETRTHLGYEFTRPLRLDSDRPHSRRLTMIGELDDYLVHWVQLVALFDLEPFTQKPPLGDLELTWSSPSSAMPIEAAPFGQFERARVSRQHPD